MAVEKFSILQIVDHNSYELCRRKELMKLEKKKTVKQLNQDNFVVTSQVH